MRECEKKLGTKKKGAKRSGYKTERWEPKLFTIHMIDNEGKPIKTFDSIYDATMKDHEETFDLIEQYLKALNIHATKQIVFCGNGCVESAIRRVINLRLKSTGSFWFKPVAEYMLFLRPVLLSGRWKNFMTKFSGMHPVKA